MLGSMNLARFMDHYGYNILLVVSVVVSSHLFFEHLVTPSTLAGYRWDEAGSSLDYL